MVANAVDIQRKKTAIHEAGHAVVGALLGGFVRSANIVHQGNWLGVAWVRPPRFSPRVAIAVAYAGSVAGWHYDGRVGAMLGGASRLDRRFAAEALIAAHGGCVEPNDSPVYRDGVTLARVTVLSAWGAIAHVAKWLLAHDEISGELVAEIVKQHETKRRGKL